MRILLMFILAFSLALPAFAADADKPAAAEPAQTEPAPAKAEERAPEKSDADAKKTDEEPAGPVEYTSPYYKVTVPAGWKAIIPPTDQQGTTNAIFSKTTGNATVTLIIGPNGGANAKAIAQMFAEQFKSPKPPVEKNGLFSFSFPQNDGSAHAYVGSQDSEFIVMVFGGNEKEGMQFVKDNVKSETHAALLPK